ncbi:MAG TPA: response regulator [Nitrososphaeraceae archaeon]|nr:response regulator [Nitrososphaeraceae archaeon]
MAAQNSDTPHKTGEKQELPYTNKILIVDDDPDITLTYKTGIESANKDSQKPKFEVHVFNNPLEALSNFKSDFYDLLLVDITMPNMNGFELAEKILKEDANVKVCFISAKDLNIESLREVYPTIITGSFISKPVHMDELVRRISSELE